MSPLSDLRPSLVKAQARARQEERDSAGDREWETQTNDDNQGKRNGGSDPWTIGGALH